MILALRELGRAASPTEAKKKITEAVKMTSQKLGNRPAACRAYYIHPAVPEPYLDGILLDTLARSQKSIPDDSLRPEERAALRLVTGYRSSRTAA